MELRDPLPTIPIPRHPPDEDVLLNLGEALRAVYEEAAYELSINYAEDPPPPALSETDRQIVRAIVP